MPQRISAPKNEGIGLKRPRSDERDPAHENPQWYELGTDDDFNDPDEEPVDPLPTARHRSVPDDLPTID